MKVLWFTNTPSLYKKEEKGYNGGGWISSLENLLLKNPDIELAISFFHTDTSFKVPQQRVTYYPVALYNSTTQKLKHNFFYSSQDAIEVAAFMKVVEDFKPDIIHIFGSENSFGLIAAQTNIPVVIHIQGILNPYLNAWFPPGSSCRDYFRYQGLKKAFDDFKTLYFFRLSARREERILKGCKHFMGRTAWDKNVVLLYAPAANYFHCGEVLREPFYDAAPWQKNGRGKIVIVTTISKVIYKGFDLVLKTAMLLKKYAGIDFEWQVFGISEYGFWERKLKMEAAKLNVQLMGVANAAGLISALQQAHMFVHPSYIDNSPNSICEAQLLGCPVIATNVGGIPTIIEDRQTGWLVPANDPYTLAAAIAKLGKDDNMAAALGKQARVVALKRHDRENIVDDIMHIYKSISTV